MKFVSGFVPVKSGSHEEFIMVFNLRFFVQKPVANYFKYPPAHHRNKIKRIICFSKLASYLKPRRPQKSPSCQLLTQLCTNSFAIQNCWPTCQTFVQLWWRLVWSTLLSILLLPLQVESVVTLDPLQHTTVYTEHTTTVQAEIFNAETQVAQHHPQTSLISYRRRERVRCPPCHSCC